MTEADAQLLPIPDGFIAIGAATADFEPVAQLADLPAGAMLRVSRGDLDVVLVHSEGGICAIDDRCPHMAAPPSRGRPCVALRTTRTIRSAIEIRAPLDVVWRVLTDFDAYPAWNPHVRRVVGRPKAGGRLGIHTRPPGGRTVVMRPVILSWAPP